VECPDVETIIAWAADPEHDSSGVAAHVKACQTCASRLRELERARSSLGRLLRHTVPERAVRCPEAAVVRAYSLGQLGAPKSWFVAMHIKRCEACLLAVARARLSGAAELGTGPPTQLTAQAKQIGVPRGVRGAALRWRPVLYGLAGAALLCATVVVILHFRAANTVVNRTVEPPPTPRQVAQVPPGPPINGTRLRSPSRVSAFRELAFRYQSGPHGPLEELALPSEQRVALASGGRYGFRVRVAEEGWVYVFQLDSYGVLAQLHPSSTYGGDQNPLKASQDYYLPQDRRFFQLDEATGVETIYVVYSREERKDLEDEAARIASGDLQAKQRLIDALEEMSTSPAGGCTRFSFDHVPRPR
jgi:hypothetical protein